MSKHNDISGETFGTLLVLGYDHSDAGGTFWKVRCSCGVEKVVARRNLTNGAIQDCGRRKVHGVRVVRYSTIHNRLRTERGKAAEYLCVDCGEQAQQWSFIGKVGMSEDLYQYEPRCTVDHRAYDRKVKVSA